MELSDFLQSINKTKINLMVGDNSAEKHYVPFVVNKCLSYFADTIFHANMMNYNHIASKKMQYDYYLSSVSKKNRFSKWTKPENTENIDLIKEYYGYSDKKAKEVAKILSQEQLKIIKDMLNKGGKP